MRRRKGEQFTPELIWLFRELAEPSPNLSREITGEGPERERELERRGKGLLTDELSLHIQLFMNDGTKLAERVCVAGGVRKLNRMVSAIYDGALADTGLKTSQFSVLVAVFNRGKVRPAELTSLLQMDESTLSRNVERMCARGWLKLERGDDRRSHLIEVTDKGRALIRKCLPAWQRAQDEVSQRLGADSVAALRSALRKLSV